MQRLNPELLRSLHSLDDGPTFYATTKAHGLYNTFEFVLRLSPKVHRILSDQTPGMRSSAEVGFDGAQAMSTFLHETIHWWQHIGSTYGLIFGLNYPVQSHCTHKELKALASGGSFVKSIQQFAHSLGPGASNSYSTEAGLANFIINQHFDLEAYRLITFGGSQAEEIVRSPLFESVGHAFYMTYVNTVNVIGSTIDQTFSAIPNPSDWQHGFKLLKAERAENHFYGGPIKLWPFGSREIFEGQARFSQIQYIYNASGRNFTWEDLREIGWFAPVYVEAFKHFLTMIEEEWPSDIGSPLVGLFLLVCDFSINPGSGFPFPVEPNFHSFLDDVTPAARFVFACHTIKNKFPAMKSAVLKHNREEFENLTGEISETLKEPSPSLLSTVTASWFTTSGPLGRLREQFDSYTFEDANYSVRFLLAHFFAFQHDKASHPEVICWPGSWMAGPNADDNAFDIFNRHGAPFVDKEDDDGIFPRLQPGRTEQQMQDALDNFYSHVVAHGLTDQWISESGPFRYDLSWLTEKANKEEARHYIRSRFQTLYGLNPDDVRCL